MFKVNHKLIALLLTFSSITSLALKAEDGEKNPPHQQNTSKKITPFTGKITRNKVRLRLQPNLESPILREFSKGDLVIVEEENEEFYAIKAPLDMRAYVFRTYVLDNIVEASHVNVRLEPDTDAPVIAQLNQGDRVEGSISPLNSKWLEITPPATSHFYIAKDYVDNIGHADLMLTIIKQKNEAQRLYQQASRIITSELNKDYPDMNIDSAFIQLNEIINQYSDFTEEVAQAKDLMRKAQDAYLQKKISYLEAEAKKNEDWKNKNISLNPDKKISIEKINLTDSQQAYNDLDSHQNESSPNSYQKSFISNTEKVLSWLPAEHALFTEWSQNYPGKTMEDFYLTQAQEAILLNGTIQPYQKDVKNKPGDYLLINSAGLPIAYLYSTKSNLANSVGHFVTIKATPRPNHHFAFPAYFVLSLE